ncbi:mechanosensitive ion channel family protein [Chitinophaga niastensis]|nr:mechanosensitive ion channel domain-containing protein [Chitinophaga niastensis]
MKKYGLFIMLFLISSMVSAQDTVRPARKHAETSFFADSTGPGRSDYLEGFENIFQTLNKVPVITASFLELTAIRDHLAQSDSTLAILKARLSVSDKALTIRNLQMYNTLLDELDNNISSYTDNLADYSDTLKQIKTQILVLRQDTLIGRISRDTSLRTTFIPQLQQLRTKWKLADSLLRKNTAEVNDLKAHASANAIIVAELLYRTDAGLKALGINAFKKEQTYLWESSASNLDTSTYKNSSRDERRLTRYYFTNTSSNRHWLLLTCLLFFYWIWYNFRSLKRLNKIDAINSFGFRYISRLPIAVSLLFLLNLAPLFDLHAPAVYIEFTQSLSMLLLMIIFWKCFSRKVFMQWCVFICLFLLSSMFRTIDTMLTLQRWISFSLNLASIVYGLYFLFISLKNTELKALKFVIFSVALFVFLSLLAMLCNLFGRTTLSDILSLTAFYALAQSVSLAVFVQTIVEAFLLQIQSSRIRKHYPEYFESKTITRSIFRVATILAIVLWLIVFTTNLNLYDTLNDWMANTFTAARHVGNTTFTFSGIVLFLGIIWAANFLQRFIAYFFGDTGDDAAIDDKGQRSKLLITRLILLIAGFLMAVAASGLPLDKITVLLGALGVGVGLGLQSIVNNFVSGIILIFDRPLRIGDTVEIGDKKGKVKEISIRSSTLLTDNGAEVIIPNGDILSHNIVNWTLSNNHVRAMLTFTIDRTEHTADIPSDIKEIIRANPNVLARKEPEIVMSTINAKSLEMKVYFWSRDISQNDLTSSEIRSAIYSYFEQKGLEVA